MLLRCYVPLYVKVLYLRQITLKSITMALIKLTAIVDNISGKLNGSVFANNKGGHYVRSKSKPTNPQTSEQSLRRSIFASIASSWRELSQGQRNAWEQAAQDFPYTNRLGDTKILSGFSLHQKLNTNLTLIQQAADLAGPPSPQGVGSVVHAAGSFILPQPGDDPLSEIEFGMEGRRQATSVLVYATAGLSPGISNFNNRLRLISVKAPELSGTTTLDITQPYIARFGTPAEGSKIGFGLRIINANTGEASPIFTFYGPVYLA